VKDGDTFMVGNIRFDVMHTPGHTPEHISFIVTDTPAASGPWGIFTGDFVFVGDVGRPDLLEKAAGHVGTMDAAARTLFRSLQKFRELPDHLQVWPGHGAGSACGKALGAIASSTVGYEKIGNWGVASTNADEFVKDVLAGQPEPPRYFAQMKRINKEGPAFLNDRSTPRRLSASSIAGLLEKGSIVVDTRAASEFAAGHIPGSINIPLNGSFTTWAGWMLPYDRDLYLLVDDASAGEAVYDLAMIGLDRIEGIVGTDAIDKWKRAGEKLGTIAQMSSDEVAPLLERGEATVIDVRSGSEWEEGHLPNVRNIPAGYIADHLDDLPTDTPLVLHCRSGGRSSIAASVLAARGFTNVVNMSGGYVGWQQAGLPVEKATEPELQASA